MKPSQVQLWPRYQCGQAGDKIQRFQHDVGRTIPERMFVAVNDTPPVIDTEAFGGDRWTQLAIQCQIELLSLSQKDYLFPSRINRNRHLTTRQYAKLLKDWVASIGLDPRAYGNHSLRRIAGCRATAGYAFVNGRVNTLCLTVPSFVTEAA